VHLSLDVAASFSLRAYCEKKGEESLREGGRNERQKFW